MDQQQRVVAFEHLRMGDVEQVGGKNASLGEMISQLDGAGFGCPADLPRRRSRSASFLPTTTSPTASPTA